MITQWHKRVPAEMVFEYVGRGWKIWSREGDTVILVWPKDGEPE